MKDFTHPDATGWIAALRLSRQRAHLRLVAIMLVIVFVGVGLTLVTGPTMTPASDLLRVLSGHDVPGASFIVL